MNGEPERGRPPKDAIALDLATSLTGPSSPMFALRPVRRDDPDVAASPERPATDERLTATPWQARGERRVARKTFGFPLLSSALIHAASVAAIALFEKGPPISGRAQVAEVELVSQIPAAQTLRAGAASPSAQASDPKNSAENRTPLLDGPRKPPPEPANATPSTQPTANPRPEQAAKPKPPKPPTPSEDAAQPDPSTAMPFFSMPSNFTSAVLDGQGASGDTYKGLVFGMLTRAKQFPASARGRKENGQAIVAFAVDAQGALVSLSLTQSSGFPDLDREALDMVRRIAPFPPPPPGAIRSFAAAIAFGEQ